MKYKIGIIGLGHQIETEHLPAISLINEIVITAICDTNKEKINTVKKKIKNNENIKEYTSYHQMLEENKFDFIIIGLPHDLHLDCINFAAEKKIDILKEKPFARNNNEAIVINNLIDKYKIKVMTVCQRRFNPVYDEFRHLLPMIGKINWIEARYTIPSISPNSEWRSNKLLSGGGVMFDMGYHVFDTLMWIFDVFNEVNSVILNHHPDLYDVEDTAFVKFKINNSEQKDYQINGSIFISCIYPEKLDEINILGEKGSAKLNCEGYFLLDNKYNIITERKIGPKNRWLESSRNQISEFCNVIKNRDNKTYFGNPDFQIKYHVPLFEALYKSSNDNKPVSIN